MSITVSARTPPLAITLQHISTTAGFLKTASFTAAQSAFQSIEDIYERHIIYGPMIDGGDFPLNKDELKVFQSKAARELGTAFSKHVLAQKNGVTEDLVREQRTALELVPHFVEMDLLTREAGDVLIEGAKRYFPAIYEKGGMLGSHVDTLTAYFINSQRVPTELALRLQLAFESFGITDAMKTDPQFVPRISDVVTRDISVAMTHVSSEEALFDRYGLTHDILQRASATALIDGDSYYSMMNRLRSYYVGPMLEAKAKRPGRALHIMTGASFVAGLAVYLVGGWSRLVEVLIVIFMLAAFGSITTHSFKKSMSDTNQV